jgi:hypothetical protein
MPVLVLQEKEMVQLADAAPPHLALTRRGLIGEGLRFGAAAALASASVGASGAESTVAKDSLLTVPVEVTGSWGQWLEESMVEAFLNSRP